MMVTMATATMSISLVLSFLALTFIDVVGVRVSFSRQNEPHGTPMLSLRTDQLCPNPMFTDLALRHGASRRRHRQWRDERKPQSWIDVSFTLPIDEWGGGGRWVREILLADLAVSNSSSSTFSRAMNPVTIQAAQLSRRRWDFEDSKKCVHFFLFTMETRECAYGFPDFRPRLRPEKLPVALIFPAPSSFSPGDHGDEDDDGDDDGDPDSDQSGTEFDLRSFQAYNLHLIFESVMPEFGRCELIVQEYKMPHDYLNRMDIFSNQMADHICPSRTRACGSYSCDKLGHTAILNQLNRTKDGGHSRDIVMDLSGNFLHNQAHWDPLRQELMRKKFLQEREEFRMKGIHLTCHWRDERGGKRVTTSTTVSSADEMDTLCVGGSKIDRHWTMSPNLIVFAACIFLFVLLPIHFFHRIRGRPEEPVQQIRRSALPPHPGREVEEGPPRTEENGRPHSRECRSNYFPIRTDPSRRPQFEFEPSTPTSPDPNSPHPNENSDGLTVTVLNEIPISESPPPPYALCELPSYEEAMRGDKKT